MSWREGMRDALGMAVGTAVTAAGLSFFLIPNRLNDGGLTGVAVVLHFLLGWPVGFTLLAMNIPLLFVSSRVVGPGFGARTVAGAVALSLWLQVLPERAAVHDVLLGAVYGGALSGLGLGITFRFGGSTGGTDMVARLLRHFFHVSMGAGLLAVDFFVITLTGVMLGSRLAMYSLLALFIGTRVVDLVQEGMDYQKAAWIVARDPEGLAAKVTHILGRGVTGLEGMGMYTGTARRVLFVVVSRQEIPRLKQLVYRHDPRAFMVIGTAYEVLGEGFKRPELGSPLLPPPEEG